MYKYIDFDIHPQHDQCSSMCRRSLVASTSQPLRLRPNRYLCVLMLHALGISTLRCVAHRADRRADPQPARAELAVAEAHPDRQGARREQELPRRALRHGVSHTQTGYTCRRASERQRRQTV